MIQVKTTKKLLDLTHANNVDLSYSYPIKYLTSKKNEEQKNISSSRYIVRFLLDIFNKSETEFSKSISKCIINLDQLALQIDSLIDADYKFNKDYKVNSFNNLRMMVIDCFSPLVGYSHFDKLIADTLESVNASFKFNTTERHLIYNIEDCISFSGCTTFYLFPLLNYFCRKIDVNSNIEPLLLLVSNYIQMIDDFTDFFYDINSKINTPITNRFNKINNQLNILKLNSTSFQILAFEIRHKLEEYFEAIKNETLIINKDAKIEKVFSDWNKFHIEMRKIDMPSGNDLTLQKKYLQNVRDITPPILCYTNN